jgi:hypothetical protein
MAPRVGATVLYTLGHHRGQRAASHLVCPALVVGHNADGTLALWVYAPLAPPMDEFLRPWVPPARTAPGTAAAAGMWSPAAQA